MVQWLARLPGSQEIRLYSTIPHLPKYEISSLLPSSVAVQMRYEHFYLLITFAKANAKICSVFDAG